jgi:hypothetical protein
MFMDGYEISYCIEGCYPLDEMLWHMLVGHKANGIEFNVTYANFSSNVWKLKTLLCGMSPMSRNWPKMIFKYTT